MQERSDRLKGCPTLVCKRRNSCGGAGPLACARPPGRASGGTRASRADQGVRPRERMPGRDGNFPIYSTVDRVEYDSSPWSKIPKSHYPLPTVAARNAAQFRRLSVASQPVGFQPGSRLGQREWAGLQPTAGCQPAPHYQREYGDT